MIGQTIAHYEILEELGHGGMGVVYKARDTHLQRFVAIKVLPADRVANTDRKARFVQEARSASALNHPNIVHIYDIDQQDGIDFMAMEFVAGKTLDELMPRKGMRLNEALRITVQVADALATAHEAGIIHRDLKPGNIIVGDDGRVRVLDFGLAKLTEVVPESEETRTVVAGEGPQTEEGTILGTASYMSPEQAEGRKVDTRSDIFSFGSVFYEMLTGQRPFRGDSSMSTLAAIIKEEPKPLRTLAEDLPGEIERIVRRCLRKDTERRFQYMKDLRVELEELKEESDSGTLAGAGVPPTGSRPASLARVVGLAVVVAVLGTGTWFWLSRSSSAPPTVEMTMKPLTTYAGREQSPTFSPDGNEVAFSWDGEKQDNFDIYRKLIGSPTPLRLTSDPAWDGAPAWSPDGRSIVFYRLSGNNLAVVLIPAIGGPERVLHETQMQVNPQLLIRVGLALAWLPDSKWIALSGTTRINTETGEVRQPWERPPEVVFETSSSVSPDGRQIAFCRGLTWVHWEIFVQSLSEELTPTGEARQLTSLNACSTSPSWTADGSEIVFSSGTYNGQKSLWRVAASGASSPKQLLAGGAGATSPAISADGNQLAYATSSSKQNIMRLSMTEAGEAAGDPVPLIASTRNDLSAQYSPDGKRVAYVSDRTGQTAIWIADADGSNAAELFSQPGEHLGSPRWSPDGRHLAFDLRVDGQQEIFAIAAGGGTPMRITEGPASNIRPSWSRDGKWIYFASDRTSRYEIWRASPTGGAATQITQDWGHNAFESADGRFVYFTKGLDGGGASELWRVPADGGQATKVVDEIAGSRYALADEGLYYIAQSKPGEGLVLKFLRNSTGKEIVVTRLESRLQNSPMSVSPDGRFILFTSDEELGSDLMLMENFR